MCQNYAKAELMKIKRYDAQIDSLISEVLRIRGLALKVTATLSGDVGGGFGNKDKIADAVARIVDLEKEINHRIDALVDLKKRLLIVVEKLPEANYISVLYRRYFLYESFEKISADLGYSYRNICYIHGKALQELNENLKGEVKDEPD